MTDLEKLAESVSLLADCVEEQNKSQKRLLSIYKMLEKRVEDIEKNSVNEFLHKEDCLIGSYDRDSSHNEDRYVTYHCSCGREL